MVQVLKKQVLTRQQLKRNVTPNQIKKVNTQVQTSSNSDIDRQIREIDEAIINSRTVQEAIDIYNSLDPIVQKRVTNTPEKIRQVQQEKIKELQNALSIARKREEDYDNKYSKEDNDNRKLRYKARESRYRAEADELQNFINKIKKGELYDINRVKQYVREVGRSEGKEKLSREKSKLETDRIEKLLNTGNITEVKYDKGKVSSAVVNGKKVDLQDYNVKDLTLSSVQKSKIATKQSSETFNDVREQYDKALEKFKGGSLTPTQRKNIYNDLIKIGLDGNAITNLVNAYENSPAELNKIKNKNFNQLWEKLSSRKPSQIAVDQTTLNQAYKTTVNQELKKAGLKPVSLSSNLDTFEKEYKKLLDRREQLRKNLTKDVQQNTINQLLKNELSLENKAITGQSMTPKQIKLWKKQIELQGKNITKQQLDIAKKLWNLPAVYASTLTIRKRQGEKNPLFTDFKKIGKGALKEIGDLINVVTGVKGLTINSKGESFDGIIAKGARGFLDYEVKVINELAKGKSVKSVIGSDLKKIAKESKELGKKTVDVLRFIKENPIGTLIIVSAGISAGVIVSKKEFLKNPEENIGRAIVWLFPTKKVSTLISKISDSKAVKYGKNTFTVSSDIGKQTSVIKGNIKGKLENGKDFTTNYVLRYNPKKKEFTGFQKTIVDKKVFKENLKLVDKGAYYIDVKTGEKISKRVSPITKQNITIKQTTITPKDNRDIFNLRGDINQKEQTAKIKTIVTKIADGLQKQTTRISGVAKRVDKDTGKIISGLGKQLSKSKTTAKKIQKFQQLTPAQVKQVENFFKDISYSKTLLEGLDKRTRMARALGLRKSSPKIKSLEVLVDKNGNIKSIFRQVKVKQKGEIFLGKKPVKVRFNISLPKGRKLGSLRKNKRGNVSIVTNDRISLTKQGKNKRIDIEKTIKIPEIKPKLPLTKANIKLYGIGKLLLKLSKQLYSIKQNINKGQIKDFKQLNKQIKKAKDLIKKINTQIKKVENTTKFKDKFKTRVKVKAKTKLKQKQITKPKPAKITKIQVARTPTIKITKPVKVPRKFKLPKLSFDSNKLNNKVAVFEAKYRERKNKSKPFNKKSNPVVTKTIRKRTTKNRMLKVVADRVDQSLVRSMNIFVKGITKQKKKDIKKPTILSKFRQKKSKNTPVLQLVEKSKFVQDTKGEKSEIKMIKKRVKTKKPTKSKKKASPKRTSNVSKVSKSKKSSKIKSKRKSSKNGKKKR